MPAGPLPVPHPRAWLAFGRWGLRRKLVSLVVFALLPVFVFEMVQIGVRFQSHSRQVQEDNLQYAETVGSAFKAYLDHLWATEGAIGASAVQTGTGPASPQPGVVMSNLALDRLLADQVSEGPLIRSASWVLPDGTVAASSDLATVGSRVPNASTLASIRAGQDEIVSDLAASGQGSSPALLVERGIRPQTELVGVVAMVVDSSRLGLVLPAPQYGSRDVGLVDPQGIVAFSAGPASATAGQGMPNGSLAWEALDGQVASGATPIGTGGARHIGAAVPVPGIGWAAYASTPAAEVLSGALREVALELLVLLAITGGSVAAALAIGRGLLGPIRSLQNAAIAISQGDLTARVPVSGSDELAVASLAFDRMADRIAELETELDRFFTLSNDLFCILGVDGRFKRLNPACAATLGFSTEELLSRTWVEFVHPEDREALTKVMRALASGEAAQQAEGRLVCRDGSYKWILWNAKAHGGVLYAVGHDITERRRTEEALAASSDRFRTLIAASPVPIVTTGQGRVTMWNPAAEQAFGWREDEVLGLPLPILPEDGAEGEGPSPEALSGATVRRVRRDGSRVDMLASEAPLVDAAGRVYGQVTIYVDVTERNRFLQIAAHELRNPMAGVKAVLGLLHRRIASGQPPGDLLRMADIAEREVDRLAALLNEILEAFRVQEGRLAFRRQRVDLADVVGAACRSLVAASDRIVLQGVSSGPVWVWGDGQRLEEVVRNLVGNAVKYSADGSEIRVAVNTLGDRSVLSVADHGLGIPKDQMGRVFEEFFRASNLADADPGGLGLGLYICRDIVRRHGGRIWVESEQGVGSTFYVELPRSAGAPASETGGSRRTADR